MMSYVNYKPISIIMKKITFTTLMLFIACFTYAETYYWVGGLSQGDISTATNWNTNINGSGSSRVTPAIDDILIFDGTNVGGSTPTTTASNSRVKVRIKEAYTVGGIYLQNGVFIELMALGDAPNSGSNIQYILEAQELRIDASSTLYAVDNPNVSNTYKYKLHIRSKGDIYGKIRSEGTQVIFRTLPDIDPDKLSPLVFKSGSSFHVRSAETTLGSVVGKVKFESGSTCEWYSGSGPLSTVGAVVLDPGSLFIFGQYTSGINANQLPDAGFTFGDVRVDAPINYFKDLKVNGTLTLTQRGKLTIKAGKSLEMLNNGHIVIERDDDSKGKLVFENITAATTFPVGVAGKSLPVTITPSASSTYEVSVFEGITADALQTGTPLTADQRKKFVNAVWDITRTSGSGNATVEFGWTDASEGTDFGLYQSSGVRIAQFGNGNWTSNYLGTGSIVNNNASAVLGLGTSPMSFTITNISEVLPIHLHDFTAKVVMNAVELKWKATESNFSHYNLQRSVNGQDFETISEIFSDKQPVSSYNYLDLKPSLGTNYYRLVSVDKDGTTEINKTIVTANFAGNFSFYPNPVRDVLNVSGLSNNDVVKIVDLQGKVLLQHKANGSVAETIQVGSINSGNYLLFIEHQGKVKSTEKMIKL